MSKGYTIDHPHMGDDSDYEEDIVLGNFRPSALDKSLLDADEQVLKGLNRTTDKMKPSSFFSRQTFSQKYKQVAGTGKKQQKDNNKRPKMIINPNAPGGYAQISPYGQSQNSDDESDDDYPSDIEIDIRARPRRHEIGRRTRKMYWAMLACLCFFGFWLFLNNVNPLSRQRSLNRTLYSNGTHGFRPTTIVVSLDGFHPHYIGEKITPNLHALMNHHSGAPYMIPSFPSSSFPNHWTMATGKYPAHHGIVGDSFYDVALGKQFVGGSTNNSETGADLDSTFWGGEPIWQTASFQGVTSAVHMWPGSDVRWFKEAPIYIDKFSGDESLQGNAQKLLSWVDLDMDTRPELIMSYVPTMKTVSEAHGIAGDQVVSGLKSVDAFVGSLLDGLEARNLTNIVNLVLVSDSGLAPTSPDRFIYLDDLVEMDNIERVDGYPLLGLRPKPSINIKNFYRNLKSAEEQFGEGKWNVYLRENMPKEYKFGGPGFSQYKERLAPLWLIPKIGWTFTTKDKDVAVPPAAAMMGYNNTEVLMRALFLATGPYFKNEFYAPFENVGFYNLLCDTLSIKPSRNDGPAPKYITTPLSTHWKDDSEYPGLPFNTKTLSFNSTYDDLFATARATQNRTHTHGHSPTTSSLTTTNANTTTISAPAHGEEETGKSASTWWNEWYQRFHSKATAAKDWVKDKYNSLKGTSTKSG